jgi:hypothetical protein
MNYFVTHSGLRTFLSDAYQCDAEWKGRLNNPLLEKLKNGKSLYNCSVKTLYLKFFYYRKFLWRVNEKIPEGKQSQWD